MQDYGAKKRRLAKERSKAARKKSMRTGSVTGLLIFVKGLAQQFSTEDCFRKFRGSKSSHRHGPFGPCFEYPCTKGMS